jgi:hypothetical protein
LEPIHAVPNAPSGPNSRVELPRVNPGLCSFGNFGPQIGKGGSRNSLPGRRHPGIQITSNSSRTGASALGRALESELFELGPAGPEGLAEPAVGPGMAGCFGVNSSGLVQLDGVLCQILHGPSGTRSCFDRDFAPALEASSRRREQERLPGLIPIQSALASRERSYAYFTSYRRLG